MGYLRPDKIDTVDLPTAGYWVKMRDRVTGYDHSLSVATSIEEISDGDARRWVVQNEVLAIALITEWNIDDAEGNVLAITRENIARLDHADYEFLLLEAGRRRQARSEEKEAPFVKRSRRPSKGTK